MFKTKLVSALLRLQLFVCDTKRCRISIFSLVYVTKYRLQWSQQGGISAVASGIKYRLQWAQPGGNLDKHMCGRYDRYHTKVL